MKLKIILLIVLVILIIYKLNGNQIETFQNDEKSQLVLKQELTSLFDIPEERLDNIKISGLDPDITITFYIRPRDINDEESPNLENIKQNIENMKKNMNYQLTINGELKNFKDISVNAIEKSKITKFEQLKNKFIDPNIDSQIQHLNDVKYFIKDGVYLKHDNPMDRFYKFNKFGDLTVEEEIQNPEPTDPQTEKGVLDNTQ